MVDVIEYGWPLSVDLSGLGLPPRSIGQCASSPIVRFGRFWPSGFHEHWTSQACRSIHWQFLFRAHHLQNGTTLQLNRS